MDVTAIAVVEDNCMARAGIEHVIGRDPRLEVVASVSAAAELDQLAVTPDLVIWDWASGQDDEPFQVIRSLAERGQVLVICALDGSMDLLAALRSGASGLVTRQTGDAEFLTAVQAAAAGALYLPPGLAGQLSGELRKRRLGEPATLAPREIETLRLIADGYTHRQIARRLGLTELTVSNYVRRIRGKLNAGNKAELTRKAIELGYVTGAGAGPGHAVSPPPRRLAAVKPITRPA